MRKAGKIFFKIGGTQYAAKGNFTYNLGRPKRNPITGEDEVHGFSETPQPARIEGEITDGADLDLKAFVEIEGETVTLELNNGKTVMLRDAWYAADGDAQTQEGNIQVIFHAPAGEEV